MADVILYPNGKGGICVVHISPTADLTTEQIAKKATPTGVKYKIIDSSELPTDRELRTCWEYDFTVFDGFGE